MRSSVDRVMPPHPHAVEDPPLLKLSPRVSCERQADKGRCRYAAVLIRQQTATGSPQACRLGGCRRQSPRLTPPLSPGNPDLPPPPKPLRLSVIERNVEPCPNGPGQRTARGLARGKLSAGYVERRVHRAGCWPGGSIGYHGTASALRSSGGSTTPSWASSRALTQG